MKKLNKLSIVKVISIPIISVALGTAFINATSGVSTITAENLKTIQTKLSSINGSKFNETIASLKQFKFHNTNGQLQVNLSTQGNANKVDVPNYKVINIDDSKGYIVKTSVKLPENIVKIIINKIKKKTFGVSKTSKEDITTVSGFKFTYDKNNQQLYVELSDNVNTKTKIENYIVFRSNADTKFFFMTVREAVDFYLTTVNGVITGSNDMVPFAVTVDYTNNKLWYFNKLKDKEKKNKIELKNYLIIEIEKTKFFYRVDKELDWALVSSVKKNILKNGIQITLNNDNKTFQIKDYKFTIDRETKKIISLKLQRQKTETKETVLDINNKIIIKINGKSFIVNFNKSAKSSFGSTTLKNELIGEALEETIKWLQSKNGDKWSSIRHDNLEFKVNESNGEIKVKLKGDADLSYKILNNLIVVAGILVDKTKNNLDQKIIENIKDVLNNLVTNKTNIVINSNKFSTTDYEFIIIGKNLSKVKFKHYNKTYDLNDIKSDFILSSNEGTNRKLKKWEYKNNIDDVKKFLNTRNGDLLSDINKLNIYKFKKSTSNKLEVAYISTSTETSPTLEDNYVVFSFDGKEYFVDTNNGISGRLLNDLSKKLTNGSIFSQSIATLSEFKFYQVGNKLQVNLSTQGATNKVDVPDYEVVRISENGYIVKTNEKITGKALEAIETKLKTVNGSELKLDNTIEGINGLKFYNANDKLKVNLSTQGNDHKVDFQNYKAIKVYEKNYLINKTKKIQGEILSYILQKIEGKKFDDIKNDLQENFEFTKLNGGKISIALKSSPSMTFTLENLIVNNDGLIIKQIKKIEKSNKKPSKIMFIGIALGVAVPLIGIIALIIYFLKKKKK